MVPAFELAAWGAMRDALNATGKAVYFSTCPKTRIPAGARGPAAAYAGTIEYAPPPQWTAQDRAALANSVLVEFKNNVDRWYSATHDHCVDAGAPCGVITNIDSIVALSNDDGGGPGSWRDMDMLQACNFGQVNGGMSLSEYRAHIAVWAVMAGPLILSCDPAALARGDHGADGVACLDLLKNPEVIAVNQAADAPGPGRLVRQSPPVSTFPTTLAITEQVFVRPLAADGTKVAVVLFNRDAQARNMSASWAELFDADVKQAAVRDLWKHADLPGGPFAGGFSAVVPSHDASIFEVTAVRDDQGAAASKPTVLSLVAEYKVAAPVPAPMLGEPEVVYFDDAPNITIALGLCATDDAVFGAFGSWGSTSSEKWNSYVAPVLGGGGGAKADHGSHVAGDGDGHETVGSDVARSGAGVVYAFEASPNDASGGPSLWGSGFALLDGTNNSGRGNGTYWWQGVSASPADDRVVVVAAAVRFAKPPPVHVFVSRDGGRTYAFASAAGTGIAVHQLALSGATAAGALRHLVFRTAYQFGYGGGPALVVVDVEEEPAASVSIHEVAYDAALNATGCQGINVAAEVPGLGIVAGTYSSQLAWRGGGCAAVGLLRVSASGEQLATSAWLALGGADVTAILALPDGSPRFLALLEDATGAAGGNRLVLVDGSGGGAMRVVQTLRLRGRQSGGLALDPAGGAVFAAIALGPKRYYGEAKNWTTGNATVVRIPLLPPPSQKEKVPQAEACPGGGERLYNNLCLPAEWPPRESYSRTPTKPPPPPVTIDISVGRQLFVDGWLTADTNATRTWHAAREVAGNPVVKPEEKWEIPQAYVFSGGVWFDPAAPADEAFKCFYKCGSDGSTTCLAVSEDGKAWRKPPIPGANGTNAVQRPSSGPFDGNVIWLDLATDDPSERWKMGEIQKRNGYSHMTQLASADGVTWKVMVNESGPLADRSTFFYNPFRGKWVYSIKSMAHTNIPNDPPPSPPVPAFPGQRARSYWEADDFWEGSQWPPEDDAKGVGPVPWICTDQDDPRLPNLTEPVVILQRTFVD